MPTERDASPARAPASPAGAPADAEQAASLASVLPSGAQSAREPPAVAALRKGEFVKAARLFQDAIAAGAASSANFSNLGLALLNLRELDGANRALERALEIDPGDPIAQHNLGIALMMQAKFDEALPRLRKSLATLPGRWEAHWGLGNTLAMLGRTSEGLTELRQAVDLDTSRHDIHAVLIFGLELSPQATLAEQQQERRRWYERYARSLGEAIAPFPNARDPERRLRIGYVSSDFRAHSAAMIFGPIIRYHERSAFEVFCYSGRESEDVIALSLRKAADAWRPTAGVSDEALAAQIRADRIDILVDLSGHTKGHRLLVFARKPAPVQITAWGFATGTGMRTIDYLFSDPVCVPGEVRHLFAEEIVDLPCCFCYEPPGDAPEVSPLPHLQGHPFTFGSINRTQKISDPTIALWARILRAMPDSRLLLKSQSLANLAIKNELIKRFAERGVGAERLALRGDTDIYHHLKALHEVDLALDPFPANGGITTAETLWMGVPVVTLLGTTTHGRLSAALLNAVGMPDWIARDEEEYLRLALEFAEDADYLARLRQDMRRKLAPTPVFDVRQYARFVENAYRELWRRWCRTAQ